MRLVSDNCVVLLCPHSEEGTVLRCLGASRVMACEDGVTVIRSRNEAERALDLVVDATGLEAMRYLDRFVLIMPAKEGIARQKLVDHFFSLLGEDYETYIDVERNCRNIANLLHLLQAHGGLGQGQVVVDYGCGTGLSLRVLAGSGIELVGVDRCEVMRSVASNRGMRTFRPEELLNWRGEPFDGAFSSYALHLVYDYKDVEAVWGSLKPGGVLAGNFHKRIGLARVESWIRRMGGSVLVPEVPCEWEEHGVLRVFTRQAVR